MRTSLKTFQIGQRPQASGHAGPTNAYVGLLTTAQNPIFATCSHVSTRKPSARKPVETAASSLTQGDAVGIVVGDNDGRVVGNRVGATVGAKLGTAVGDFEGDAVGSSVVGC